MLKGAGGVESSDGTHRSRTCSKLLALVLIDSTIDSDDSDATF